MSQRSANQRPRTPRHGGMGRVATEKAITFFPSLKRLLAILKPERAILITVTAIGIVSVLFNVVAPKILGRATDVIFAGLIGKNLPPTATKEQVIAGLQAEGQDRLADMLSGMDVTPGVGIDFDVLAKILLLAGALYLLFSLGSFVQRLLLNRAVQRSVYRMRLELRAKLDRLPLSYYDKQPRGELLSRITNDIDNITQTLQQSLDQLLLAVLTLLGVGVMMFTVSWQLAVLTILIVPLAALLSALIGKFAQRQFVKIWDTTGKLNGQVEEAFTGHDLVRVFGRRAQVAQRFAETNDELCQANLKAQFLSGLIMPVNTFVGNLNYVVIAVVGGLRVASGQMPLGNVQAFIQYSRMFTQPMTQIASMTNLLQSGVASAERVFQVLDAEEESSHTSNTLPTKISGEVRFDDVSFSYLPERKLIENLSLCAKPGHSVAIVGPTGAGKTTLVNLLERFYEVDAGAITLDGVDISFVDRHQLRHHLGMVLQDTWLFKGTIRENIAYGKHGASDEEIVQAAKAAYVDRFAEHLPGGLDTEIADGGSNISAGEKQLITIARAFIADPDVLILDEATSSVDTRTEVLVQRAMNQLRAGRTAFVIAHRLSTIRNADTIVVMENGTIVEQGNHKELLAAGGHYWRLHEAQFAGNEI